MRTRLRGLTDPKVTSKRLQAIKKRMKLNQREFAERLGISVHYMNSLEMGRKRGTLVIMHYAEQILDRYIRNERYRLGQKKIEIPAEYKTDIKLKAKAISLFVRGNTVEEIAQELAVRPEVIEAYVATVNTEDEP